MMTRMLGLALFDLDNTLADRSAAFRRWCEDIANEHRLGRSATTTLVEVDNDGHTTRTDFFATVKQQFGLPDSINMLNADTGRVTPTGTTAVSLTHWPV